MPTYDLCVHSRLEHYLDQIECKDGPASRDLIAEAERHLGRTFPTDLVELYERHGGLDGSITDDPVDEESGGILILYPVAELAEVNAGYDFPGPTEDFVLIGTDGGGEAYALDFREEPPSYVVVPFIGRDYEVALFAGRSLTEFFTSVARNSFWNTNESAPAPDESGSE